LEGRSGVIVGNDKINSMHEAGTAPDRETGPTLCGPEPEADAHEHPEPAGAVTTSVVRDEFGPDAEDEFGPDAELVRAARAFLVARRLTRIGLGITALGVMAVAALTTVVLAKQLPVPTAAIWGSYAILAAGVAFWALATGFRHVTADRLWTVLRFDAALPDGWSDSLFVNARRLARSAPADASNRADPNM
jgi:hypothetical protein